MKNVVNWSAILVCASALSAFAQNKDASTNQPPASQVQKSASGATAAGSNAAVDDTWARIILDKKFAPVWADAERTYNVMRAFDSLPSGGELLGFEGMIKNALKDPLTRDALEAQFGKPNQAIEEGDTVWLDYGPIQFKTSKGDKEVTTFRAKRDFYRLGFVEVAKNSIKKQDEGESKTK